MKMPINHSLDTCDVIEIRFWKNRSLHCIKPLIPLRIGQILWAGSGEIIVIFYSIILKQRGVSLLELSSIFSVSFLFQFAAASICGIIADRLGYAKPVLLFLILSTLTVIICILLVPDLRSKTCEEFDMDIKCYNSSENQMKLNFCNICEDTNPVKGNETFEKSFHQSNKLKTSDLVINDSNPIFENFSDTFNTNSFDSLCFENCSICYDVETNTNKCKIRDGVLLAIYSILVLGLFTFWSTANRFFDFVALNLAARYNSNFGKESFIATFGEFFIVAVAAFTLNMKTSDEKNTKYDLVFLCCAVTLILTSLSVFYIENIKIPPGRKLKKKTWELMHNVDTMFFLLTIFFAGNGFAFNSNFHLWFLEDLKASKTVIGLHSLTTSFYGILVLLTSKWWISRFGAKKIFIIGLLCYSINEIGYSFLYNPWLSLLLESTVVFSTHLMWVAVVVHCSEIAPKGLSATLNAIGGTVHFGIGRSSAIVGGGLLMNYYGARMAYRVFGCMILVTAVFYSVFLSMRQRNVPKNIDNEGDDVKELQHMKLAPIEEA